MKSKLAAILAAALLSTASVAFSQDATQDVDKAAKDTGHATKSSCQRHRQRHGKSGRQNRQYD